MPQQHIHCSVNNCHYWGAGNTCQASEILITSDKVADEKNEAFDAPRNAATMSTTPVRTCMETCCKTFTDKSASNFNADGVYRQ